MESGFEILVGRGARENEHLTFDVAEPQDFWLHVSGGPGSHVVIRNPEGLSELPKSVLERAAQLAVENSKAKNARGKVEVHLCQASEVRKRRGQPLGEVEVRNGRSLFVYAIRE